jgi:glucokinase
MNQVIGVRAGEDIAVGIVEGNRLVSPTRMFPERGAAQGIGLEIQSMPMEAVAETVAQLISDLCVETNASPLRAGIGFPGVIRGGIIEESPNLKQAKGANLSELLGAALRGHGLDVPVFIYNDADAMAAGIAATHNQLERVVRVWTLGQGIGFGRYPHTEGVWEGGHVVVSLDPKEAYCGCGGRGHLEGIMGHRAMRLRFLDLEPEEVFASAQTGDSRCAEFETLWHRALAAGTATAVHMEGPGKFFICGPSARFVKVNLLSRYLHEMVAMSPLQGSVFEIVAANAELPIIGAAVNASRGGASNV